MNEINIDSRILRHGDKVVGGCPMHAILRVDDPDTAQPLALQRPQ